MPAGDPAGYLPNVLASRKAKGQPAYQPRAKRGKKHGKKRKLPPGVTAKMDEQREKFLGLKKGSNIPTRHGKR